MDQTPKYSQQLQGGRDKRIQQHTLKRIQETKDSKYNIVIKPSKKKDSETTKKARTLTLKQRFCGVCVTDHVYKERDVTWKD